MESNTEEVVIVSSDSEQRPITEKITRKKRNNQTPTSKEYMQEYYIRNRGRMSVSIAKGSIIVRVV